MIFLYADDYAGCVSCNLSATRQKADSMTVFACGVLQGAKVLNFIAVQIGLTSGAFHADEGEPCQLAKAPGV
jgi:hypothetical protein